MAVKNIGDLDVKDAKLTVTSGIDDYIKSCLYDLDTKECETEDISFFVGETKVLVIDGVFPKGTVYAEGQIKLNYIENKQDTTAALNIVIDRIPAYKLQMWIADKLNLGEIQALWVGALFFVGLLYVCFLIAKNGLPF